MALPSICATGLLRLSALLGALVIAPNAMAAEYVEPSSAWRDASPGAPPAYEPARLIPVEAPRSSTLSFGIDPQTLTASADGVVRYVVVASSQQGASTAMFEGIHCGSGKFRTYARRSKDESEWSIVDSPQWDSLSDTALSAHVRAIARAGVCVGNAPNTPVSQMVRDLRQASQGIR